MTKLRLGGVPEYFNLPIHQAIEQGAFKKAGIDLEWVNITEGTGRMSKMLWEEELDMAIILTEGITKSIIDGNPSRIIKDYVVSPLHWGVHVPYSKNATPISDISQHKIAISRYGSGSHLMSFVMAQNHNWNPESLHFEIVNNLNGALESFSKQESDVFLWEKYTTKPYVDRQQFSRVGIVETPWPCFVMAAGQETLEQHGAAIKTACDIISEQCRVTQNDSNLSQLIAERFELQKEDTDQIINEVRWSHEVSIDLAAIEKVIDTLHALKLIEDKASVSKVTQTLD